MQSNKATESRIDYYDNYVLTCKVLSSSGVIHIAESAAAPTKKPAQAPNEFRDGRPPKWTKTSTRTHAKEQAPAKGSIQGRIVGGTDADIGELPYQVAILLKDSGQICGGTVYNENYIVTAAHCVYEDGKRLQAKDFTVVAGELNLRKPGEGEQSTDVLEITVHPEYTDNDGFNDLAIFKLKKPLKWTETVRPLRIATKADEGNRQEKALVSGWGYTVQLENGGQINDELFPDTLKMVDVKIISKPQCETLHRKMAYKWAKHPSFLCAGALEGGRDSCQADSGGPLACFEKKTGKKFHCGIVANGIGCARKNTPGFYTDVAKFSDWIIKHAGRQTYV